MKKFVSIFVFSALLFAMPASVLAAKTAKGFNVAFPVTVVDNSTDPAKIIKKSVVAMYKVKLVKVKGYDDVFEYKATQYAIKMTGYKGTAAKFIVKPNEVVYFLGFKSKKDALKIKTFTPETPPVKNFTKLDGKKKRLCMTDGTDFSNKFQIDGQEWCYNSLTVEVYNPSSSDIVVKNNESDILVPVTVIDGSTVEPGVDTAKILPNTFVAMYSVVTDEVFGYDGTQVAIKPTGSNGLGAKFLVKLNEVVYFVGFSSAEAAAENKKYVPTTPPLKNFDGAGGLLCMTDGTDFSKKFQIDPLVTNGQGWCYDSWTTEILK